VRSLHEACICVAHARSHGLYIGLAGPLCTNTQGLPELYRHIYQCSAHTASFKNGTVNNDRK